ncbi:mitochondrial splicing system protein [Onygenales sp. PD_40]|nr:mitochondrial splicing system protein [Onygenales sp. PD_40]
MVWSRLGMLNKHITCRRFKPLHLNLASLHQSRIIATTKLADFYLRMRRHPFSALRWALNPRPSWPRLCYLDTFKGKLGLRLNPLKVSSPCVTRRWNTSGVGGSLPTIYALSTAPGRGAIAIVRISGPSCAEIYHALCPRRPLPAPRTACVRALYDPSLPPSANTVLDSGAMVLYFPGPKTVTGEDVLELHIHGGPAVIKAVLNAIPKCANTTITNNEIRYAEPGEFTRRAFLNDRLSLPEIEALGNTLTAETEQQRRLAVRGTVNSLAARYEAWRQQLLYARGELEALIDFSEDQHFDESTEHFMTSTAGEIRKLLRQINLHVENASKGELLRNGVKIALLGAPNAGKSSLLNRIVGREAAIVSSEEGTTRDIVDVGIDLRGYFCRFGDMAGLRSETSHPSQAKLGAVEMEGIRRAEARALESDIVVVLLPVENKDGQPGNFSVSLGTDVSDVLEKCVHLGKKVIVAVNKVDNISPDPDNNLTREAVINVSVEKISLLLPMVPRDRIFHISCKDAKNDQLTDLDPGNIQALLNGLVDTIKEIATPSELENENDQFDQSYWEDSLGVTHRQSSNLQSCVLHLNDFLSQTCKTPENAENAEQIEVNVDIVTAAEHLRFAADCLAKITGRGESGDVEDVLGVVFEK